MSKKTEYVTRRVVEETRYEVYEVKNGSLNLLGEEITKGKLSAKKMCNKYKVDDVHIILKDNKVVKYAVPVEKFMESPYLVKINDDGTVTPVNSIEEPEEVL